MSDETIFSDALAIVDPTERKAYLDRVCPDWQQRNRILDLLQAAQRSNPLDRPPNGHAKTGAFIPEPVESEPLASIGDRVGPYKLLEKIGEGGMGEVWVADQLEPIKRRVALKLIKPGMDSRSVLARFEAERQALAVMDHPNIAKVLDAGTTTDGRPYFVMELVKGTPITEFCDARKLTPKQRLELFIPVCQAIQHAHMKGIIHRDIKPSNVLVALHDEVPVPKVIDFGVAKAIGQQLTEKTIYTGFGALVGTPAYMAPEQATFNQLDVDTRADVYALGVLLYELLAGSPPIEAERMRRAALDEVLRIVRDEEPPRPSQRLSTSHSKATIAATRQSDPAKLSALMKGEIDWIVMKALEKDRTRRYDTANGLAKDIQRYLSGDSVEACPPTLGYRLRKAYRRNRAAVWVVTAFLGLSFVAGNVIYSTFRLAMSASLQAIENQIASEKSAAEARAERDRVSRTNAELRLTRYIAEMNLVQSAHAKGDLEEVKRLLDAQPVDLRGLEWHYWDRRMNGFDRECRVTCPPVIRLRSGFLGHESMLAADGRTLAIFQTERDGSQLVRVWDILENRELRTIRLLLNENFRQAELLSSSIQRLTATSDGRGIVFDCVSSFAAPQLGRNGKLDDLIRVDLATGERVRLKERTGWPDEDFYTEEFFTDDGGYIVTASRQGQLKDLTCNVKRLADQAGLGSYFGPSSFGSRLTVCPDGKHLISVGIPPFFSTTSSRGALECWKFGQKEPAWREEVDLNRIDQQLVFGDGGKSVRHMALIDGYWELVTRDLASGKVVRSDRVVPAHEVRNSRLMNRYQTHAFDPAWAISADGRRLAYAIQTGVMVCDLGLSRTTRESLTQKSPIILAQYKLETFEGQPSQLVFLPDGRVAASFSMHSRPSYWNEASGLNQAIAQVFTPPPYGFAVDHATEVMAKGSDRLLLRPHRRDAKDIDKAKERLCVVDRQGQLLYDTDLGPAPAFASAVLKNGSYAFTPDGRYLYGVDEYMDLESQPDGAGSVVFRDLTLRKETLRLTPPVGERFYLPSLDDAGKRLVVTTKDRNDPEYGPRPKATRGKLAGKELTSAASVFEFPSGKHLVNLDRPPGLRIKAIKFDQNGFVGTGTLRETSFRWNDTGRYLGEEPGPDWRLQDQTGKEEWQERGNRVIRIQMRRDERRRVVDVWDVSHRGSGVPPLASFEIPEGQCLLSPDGSRLMIIGYRVDTYLSSQTALYCTTTGRKVLVLNELLGGSRSSTKEDFALWSPDGKQFWYGVDGHGKPVGWDFRPREKK
jgi:serine/threonine protein kinase